MDIEKILLILERLKKIGVSGKKIMNDGKVDLADLPEAISLLSDVKLMMEAFQGAKEAFGELKNLDLEEAKEVISALYDVGDAIENA